MRHERTVVISAQHPSLPGHFPGNPVVPGVVVLEEVLAGICALDPLLVVVGFPAAKLSAPLKPGEMLTIHIEQVSPGEVEFRCLVEARLVAAGTVQICQRASAHTGPR